MKACPSSEPVSAARHHPAPPPTFTTFVEGIGFWAPTLPDWPAACAAFRGDAPASQPGRPIPPPHMLSPAERRRAPQTVALALTASEEAVRASGRTGSELMAVFTSAHGDLPIIDHICTTLVQTPLLVSPTRFLHSIHNAPAGLWSMLNHNHQANSSVSGATHSFAAGLMEALVLSQTQAAPVLLTGFDTAAVGALTHTTRSQGALAVALVLSAQRSERCLSALHWSLAPLTATAPPEPETEALRALADNGMADALPLMGALAAGEPRRLALPLSAHQCLQIDTLAASASGAPRPLPLG